MSDMVGSARQIEFGRNKATSLPRMCRECDVLYACHGGCPKDRFARTPDGEPWLRQFKVVLLGGSAVPPACLRAIRDRRLPVFLTYGMTETAAACALCPPERLWRNQPPRGTPLPGVRFGLAGDRLTIATPALAREIGRAHV